MSTLTIGDLRQEIEDDLAEAIADFGRNEPRTVQGREGHIGPSDLGFCRQKAALMTKGVQQTDERSLLPAQIGTSIHAYAAQAFAATGRDWITYASRLTATFPSGAEISGTPDLIMIDRNTLIDVKTKDGFSWVKREGSSLNDKYQRHTYVLGAIAAGLLDEDQPIYVGNLYIDRSGKEKRPYLELVEFDPTLTIEIDSWIGDVIYAVRNDEDAMRDIPSPICEQICEFFTACRGNLPVEEGGEIIEDAERLAAIKMFVDGRALAKEGDQMKKEAGAILADTDGIATIEGDRWQVRNTWVNPTMIEGYERAGFNRLDIRKMRT
jgi:hypothetical protein